MEHVELSVADLERGVAGHQPAGGRDLADLVPMMRRWWRPWVFLVGAVTAVALVMAFLLPPRYTATASLMSVGSGMSHSPLGRLAQIANLVPSRADLAPEAMITILGSRRIANPVLDRAFKSSAADQRSKPFKNWLTETEPGFEPESDVIYRKFSDATRFRVDPETRIVHLRVETRYAFLSAEVANALIQEASRYATMEHQNRSRIVRGFVGDRLEVLREQLKAAEDELYVFYDSNHNYAQTSDPDIQIARLRLERQVELKSRVVAELTAQYETAAVEERNEAPMIQVIDRATVPDLPSWPARKLVVLLSAGLAGLVGLVGIVFADGRYGEAAARWRWPWSRLRGRAKGPGTREAIDAAASVSHVDDPVQRKSA